MKPLNKSLIWLMIAFGLIHDSMGILFGRLSDKPKNKPTANEKKMTELEIRARYAELGNC